MFWRKLNLRFRRHPWQLLAITGLLVAILYVVWHFALAENNLQLVKPSASHSQTLILWWSSSLPANYNELKFCDLHFCTFSTDRARLKEAQVVVFYASDMHLDDWPLPRPAGQLWALLHDESPRNVPYIMHQEVLQHFNYTSTFSRYSDYPLTTHHLKNLKLLSSARYMVHVGEKTLLRKQQKLAPVAFLQTDCDTLSGREQYVKQLMQFIAVDSYGQCLHNKDLPASLTEDYLNKLYDAELLKFLARYKFILAYENGVCDDYITEKFWRPLIMGSIPVYFGSPSIRDWQPNNKSVIYISDFNSPRDLAEFLKELDADDVEYLSYLEHKYNIITPISNQRLLERDVSIAVDNLFGAFECALCKDLSAVLANTATTKMANLSHYHCALPPSHPSMASQPTNLADWTSIMQVGRCQALILDELLQQNRNFSKSEFDRRMQTTDFAKCGKF